VPWFSYHGGHSGEFCRHAKGELLAVVEAAVARGFTHYGLSEHCPRDRVEDLFPDEHALGTRGLAAAFTGYVQSALSLRERFADRIELLVGFETERLPPDGWARRMAELRAGASFDYIVGSVHDVDGVYVDYQPELTADLAVRLGGREVLHARYFDALIELVQALRPEVVGHLDLVRKFDGPQAGFSPAAMRHVERVLEAVAACDGMLDVNCGAARRGLSPVYPLPAILERACQMGIPVTLGDDSHGADSVGVGLDTCLAAIAAAGYRRVSYLCREDGAVVRRSAALADVRPRVRA
jgi:histidinol-phosphatase (PHP family)